MRAVAICIKPAAVFNGISDQPYFFIWNKCCFGRSVITEIANRYEDADADGAIYHYYIEPEKT